MLLKEQESPISSKITLSTHPTKNTTTTKKAKTVVIDLVEVPLLVRYQMRREEHFALPPAGGSPRLV